MATATRAAPRNYVPQKPHAARPSIDPGKAWDQWVRLSEASAQARKTWEARPSRDTEAAWLSSIREASKAWELVKACQGMTSAPGDDEND